ncbi:unnamed protein product, partial [Rotaria sp. Silwood1]
KIDCTNGFDERHCHKLEMNECNNTNEYRCVNGQCIDREFYLDKQYDCMDTSDEIYQQRAASNFMFSPDFQDRLCPLTWFSCGDGFCYDGPNIDLNETQRCPSQRDRLYFQQMPKSTFTLFTHVSLIYDGMMPKWICYNETLCPYLSMNEFNLFESHILNGSICRSFNVFNNKTYTDLKDVFKEFKHFVRSCSLPPNIHSSKECSMFSCDDKSKCLSYHRLSDGFQDCSNGEDEQQNVTCSFNLPYYRYQCSQEAKCIRKTLVADGINHCSDRSDEIFISPTDIFYQGYKHCVWLDNIQCQAFRGVFNSTNIVFSQICNGILENLSDADNNTDESDCSMDEWRCLTQYTKCDNTWHCLDGQDELGCKYKAPKLESCTNQSHVCLDIMTGSPMCLDRSKVADGHIDCVGSIDERAFCRIKYKNNRMQRYRCHNSDLCITPFQVCDCHQDCPENDDETLACIWMNNGRKPLCDESMFRCRDGRYVKCDTDMGSCRCHPWTRHCLEDEHQLFCDLIDQFSDGHFTMNELEEYPNVMKHRVLTISEISKHVNTQQCNQGLHILSANSSIRFYCLCSDHYYGDRCQYQRKRVSLILRPFITDSFDHQSSFKIVVLLVHQNTTIVSHDQFLYEPQFICLPKYYLTLLYPINESSLLSSSNYSVHIYSFTSQTLEKRSSWQFDIPFHFLPVNRIAKRLLIAGAVPTTTISSWSKIYNGNCSSCSEMAICIGYDIDIGRDICICPLNRTGRRCLIPFNPCTNNSCNGHGQCIQRDVRFDPEFQFRCVCDDGWRGDFCEDPSAILYVSFAKDIDISIFKIALIHVIDVEFRPLPETYFHRLSRETSNITVFLNTPPITRGLIFIQMYKSLDEFDTYLVVAYEDRYIYELENIRGEIHPSRRCRSINELFNLSVISQPPLRRVKYYQQPCLRRISGEKFPCFYDEQLLCLCDRTNYANCFTFNLETLSCLGNKCSNRGKCIQTEERCPTGSFCFCEPCNYGSICQFTTSGYAMSLDAILGSHVHRITPNIRHQTTIIQISVAILTIVICIGILLDAFAIGTFAQKSTRQVGSGLYLLISSLISLFTLIILMCKIMFLISVEQHNISCLLFEFLLKWGSTCSEWLYACVAIERTLAVIQQTKYSNQGSKRRAKWIITSVLISTG